MPRGDRSGPWGRGSMTGRGAGFCGGFGMPGYMNAFPGRGMRGFGYARGVDRVMPPEADRVGLQRQVEWLEQELAAIRGRLADIAPREEDAGDSGRIDRR